MSLFELNWRCGQMMESDGIREILARQDAAVRVSFAEPGPGLVTWDEVTPGRVVLVFPCSVCGAHFTPDAVAFNHYRAEFRLGGCCDGARVTQAMWLAEPDIIDRLRQCVEQWQR